MSAIRKMLESNGAKLKIILDQEVSDDLMKQIKDPNSPEVFVGFQYLSLAPIKPFKALLLRTVETDSTFNQSFKINSRNL